MSARRLALAGLAAAALALPAAAQEGRGFNPIARPSQAPVLPDGAVAVNPPRPLPRETIERAVRQVLEAWNERRLDRVLAKDFRDRERLVDALETKVPRDAKLRLTAVQGWQVLSQFRRGATVVSRVSVTVRTQVEFNDPAAGFQARDGTNEFVLTVTGREAP